jgi:indole-3-glycerol phosphate synthase/phosphoribosylanthranilate isomerase
MGDFAGILGEIVARKRRDVAARFAFGGDPRNRARPTSRSLRDALARPGARFIMEVKRASPSQGALREGVNPAAMARAYKGSADAVSVLTDGPYFGGSLDDLRAVRAEFDGVVLAKDFVIDVRQVAEARLAGADAVLVMLSVLDDTDARMMMDEAARLGMDALVEVHDEAEAARAVALGAPLVGINNRDLRTLKVDLATTERLSAMIPRDRLLVSESGVSSREDVERLSPHADAFLVGSALMRADDPAAAARVLAYGRVKVCGLTQAADVAMAAANGASFAGLIMVPGTPRAVAGDKAEALAQAARESGLAPVGVFRNEKLMQVAMRADAMGLHAVQLHGDEDAAYIAALKNMLPEGCELWAAGAVGEEVPEPRFGADRTLYDTKVDGRSGGTGVAFSWERLPQEVVPDAILAGGLNPGNVSEAARVGAYALDVSSGIEAEPGRKDPGKVGAFFDALRPRVRSELEPC